MTKQAYSVAYTLHTYTPTTTNNELVYVSLRLHNTGSEPWTVDGSQIVTMAYRWLTQSGQVLVADGVHFKLRHAVAPGSFIDEQVVIETPIQTGSRILRIDLVAEQIAWFSDLGSSPLDLPVEVGPSSTKPHVCIVNVLLVTDDGVSNKVIDQIRFFRQRNYPVTVFLEHFPEQGIPTDILQVVMPLRLNDFDQAVPSTALQRFKRGDLYIFHYPVHYGLAEAIQYVESGAIVFNYHGITPPNVWNDPSTRELLIRGQERAVLARYADYAVVHSEYMAHELHQHSGMEYAKIRVIPYPVEIDMFKPGPLMAELLDTYELRGKYVLLYIGRMAGNKRISDLVHALVHVRSVYPEAVLVLVGNTTVPAYKACAEEAMGVAQKYGVADAVIFTGSQPHGMLSRWYNLAHVYVTSSVHEGFCLPVIEAMASGRPVVATDSTALSTTVGNAGLLFPPKDTQAMAQQIIRILEGLEPHPM